MYVASELIDSGTIDDFRLKNLSIIRDYAVTFFRESSKPSFIKEIKERDFGGVGDDWLGRVDEYPRLEENLLEYEDNFKVVAEYSRIKNSDRDRPIEEYMYQIAYNYELHGNEDYIFGSVFNELSVDYHDLYDGGDSVIVIRNHRFNQFDLKATWLNIKQNIFTRI